MNASPLPEGAAPPSDTRATVDEHSPWLGLVSFTEETRAFFFGRDQEVAELSRRVQGKLLTVLFGKSGLGKTSILRAGLVPRLREQGYCPVYVRIDYRRDTPEPAEQIKEAIRRAASASRPAMTARADSNAPQRAGTGALPTLGGSAARVSCADPGTVGAGAAI